MRTPCILTTIRAPSHSGIFTPIRPCNGHSTLPIKLCNGISTLIKASHGAIIPANPFYTTFRRWYSPEVKEHFNNPRNVGSFDKDDPDVGTAIVGKAACGDVIKFQVKIKDGIIQDACFKTFGCGSAIASSSYVTELVKGKTCQEAIAIKNTDISEKLNLPPVKVHCSLLAEDAVKHAIKDYYRKQNEQ